MFLNSWLDTWCDKAQVVVSIYTQGISVSSSSTFLSKYSSSHPKSNDINITVNGNSEES